MIAPVCPSPSSSSDDFTPECYGGLKHPKQITSKIASFVRIIIITNNQYRGREKDNTSLKGFNNHHIKNTCFGF